MRHSDREPRSVAPPAPTLRARRVAALGVTALFLATFLIASNTGFRDSYSLLGPADSVNGTNWLALPYRNRTAIQTAANLYTDLGGAAAVSSISRYNRTTGGYDVYAGAPANDFPLTPGVGVRVVMNQTKSYVLYGAHDPTLAITLLGPEASLDGTNWYAPPYNGKSKTAGDLLKELGPQNVQKLGTYSRSADAIAIYAGTTQSNFTLVAGEAYLVQVTRTLQFVPATKN